MDEVLKQILQEKFKGTPEIRQRRKNISTLILKVGQLDRKKDWYKIGKVITKGFKVKMHKESQVKARQVYEYYKINKGDWTGSSCRKFSKMNKVQYAFELRARTKELFELNSPLNEGNLDGSLPTLN